MNDIYIVHAGFANCYRYLFATQIRENANEYVSEVAPNGFLLTGEPVFVRTYEVHMEGGTP